jgi:curved DNA-binding protein CbpA
VGAPVPDGLRRLLLQALDLAETASDDQIRSEYRRRAKLAHPDHGGDRREFERLVAIMRTLGL